MIQASLIAHTQQSNMNTNNTNQLNKINDKQEIQSKAMDKVLQTDGVIQQKQEQKYIKRQMDGRNQQLKKVQDESKQQTGSDDKQKQSLDKEDQLYLAVLNNNISDNQNNEHPDGNNQDNKDKVSKQIQGDVQQQKPKQTKQNAQIKQQGVQKQSKEEQEQKEQQKDNKNGQLQYIKLALNSQDAPKQIQNQPKIQQNRQKQQQKINNPHENGQKQNIKQQEHSKNQSAVQNNLSVSHNNSNINIEKDGELLHFQQNNSKGEVEKQAAQQTVYTKLNPKGEQVQPNNNMKNNSSHAMKISISYVQENKNKSQKQKQIQKQQEKQLQQKIINDDAISQELSDKEDQKSEQQQAQVQLKQQSNKQVHVDQLENRQTVVQHNQKDNQELPNKQTQENKQNKSELQENDTSQHKPQSEQQEKQEQQKVEQIQKQQKKQAVGTHLQPISLTEQNQATISHNNDNENQKYIEKQSKQDSKQKLVHFQEYEPTSHKNQKQKVTNNSGIIDGGNPDKQQIVKQFTRSNYKKQQSKSKISVPQAYQNIQNQQLLKRIQQLQDTVKSLKIQKQKNGHSNIENNQQEQENETETIQANKTIDINKNNKQSKNKNKSKKKQLVIHEQSVHNLVSQLAKNDSEGLGKKPVLQQKRYKKRKLDLTYLMDKNMTHASNIFNVTIGQILNPNKKDQQQKQSLRKQIRQLRQKVLKLQQDKRTLSIQKPALDTRRQTASTGKKSICGKLIKVSQLKGSRVVSNFQQNQSQFKGTHDRGIQTRSQRDSFVQGLGLKNKMSNNSSTQRQSFFNDKQKDNPNNISFRVRRPSNRASSGNNNTFTQNQKSAFQQQAPNQQQKLSIIPISNLQLKKQQQKLKENSNIKDVKKLWWQQPFIKTLEIPQLPSPPTQFDSQQDLYTLGKLTFIVFGVDLNDSATMNVRKYKNCVYFNAGEKNNILWYFDGRFYFGEWQIHLTGEGQKYGQGFEFVPQKFIYQGKFKQGKRNGFGTMRMLNKEKLVMYEGNWVDGNKNGEGKQIDQYGVKYWGQWKQNKRQGFGRLKLDDGDYFEGNFQKGIKNGLGQQTFKNGDKYQGNYLANKFHGTGKYFWKNGSVYEGDFNHGIRSGKGKWRSNQDKQQCDEYQGQYDNDKKNGFGKYKWADGSQYEGFFKDDLKQGQGTIRYKNGKVAKLLWKNGQPMKKLFSQEEKNYRQANKSKQKQTNHGMNRNQTISSRQFSIFNKDQ